MRAGLPAPTQGLGSDVLCLSLKDNKSALFALFALPLQTLGDFGGRNAVGVVQVHPNPSQRRF